MIAALMGGGIGCFRFIGIKEWRYLMFPKDIEHISDHLAETPLDFSPSLH